MNYYQYVVLFFNDNVSKMAPRQVLNTEHIYRQSTDPTVLMEIGSWNQSLNESVRNSHIAFQCGFLNIIVIET